MGGVALVKLVGTDALMALWWGECGAVLQLGEFGAA